MGRVFLRLPVQHDKWGGPVRSCSDRSWGWGLPQHWLRKPALPKIWFSDLHRNQTQPRRQFPRGL